MVKCMYRKTFMEVNIDNIYENLSLVNTSSEFKWYNKSQIKLI